MGRGVYFKHSSSIRPSEKAKKKKNRKRIERVSWVSNLSNDVYLIFFNLHHKRMKQKALALCYKRKTCERLCTHLGLTPKMVLVVNS